MSPAHIAPGDLASYLPREGRVLVLGCAGESRLLADAVLAAGDDLGALTFTGIFIPGVNRNSYLANARCLVETFFLTPELKAAPAGQVRFLPLCYADIMAHLRAHPVDAALMTVAPPDANGLCSFGNTVDFIAELWPDIPIRIAHINAAMPRTIGHNAIPFQQLTAYVEQKAELISTDSGAPDAVSQAVAGHIARFIPDGATLQTGLGKVPRAVMQALCGHRKLRIHSGLIVEQVLALIEAGALAVDAPITAGCAIGSDRLYSAIGRPEFRFMPVSVTHGVGPIARIPKFISINSTLEVDLLGQSYSEFGPKGLMSGPGGASDYARAVRLSNGGLRIVALASSAAKGSISRIVAPGRGGGPMSLGRMDVDIVVTEYGAADLRNATYTERAAALVAIAPPAYREVLEQDWRHFARQL